MTKKRKITDEMVEAGVSVLWDFDVPFGDLMLAGIVKKVYLAMNSVQEIDVVMTPNKTTAMEAMEDFNGLAGQYGVHIWPIYPRNAATIRQALELLDKVQRDEVEIKPIE